jgi:hypothetical protein
MNPHSLILISYYAKDGVRTECIYRYELLNIAGHDTFWRAFDLPTPWIFPDPIPPGPLSIPMLLSGPRKSDMRKIILAVHTAHANIQEP